MDDIPGESITDDQRDDAAGCTDMLEPHACYAIPYQ